ncbi:hypothetical protein [Escherichia coli]|uniref:Uncharacterized protein n=1 Tax=Escherichia coli TaxID=562 RepID=A0A2A2CG38_ECOLX|nr:hypothetical protein [Escherichia coli]EJN5908078.1 hypothetical protein [Escherichia coli]ELP7318743.1 hypothetical protein [Escherichia coli]PAU25764.1 hypothetical protein BTQ06_04560 [Escherichia coli]GDI38882.1 hypothetical protein BvCmsKSNP013_03535 [Escherichia coli]GDQ36469.1 hypothetical protein BvCmsNSP052_04936 [Escherichia coli]
MINRYGYLTELSGLLRDASNGMQNGAHMQSHCPTHLKGTLMRAAVALRGEAVQVVDSPGGKREVMDACGVHRVLTWHERVAIWLLGGKLEIRP